MFCCRFVNIIQIDVTEIMMTDAQRSTRSCRGLKNEDGYEISIPFEDNSLDESGFCNQNDHTFDESVSGQIPPCSPYLLITSLRAQLQISLEKNSWLQKRIEDLEEERDFLRCQLDRFIFTTKSQESNGMTGKETEAEAEPQATTLKQPTRKTAIPSPSSMMTRSGKIAQHNQKRSRNKNQEDEEVIEEEEYIAEEDFVEEEQVVTDDDGDDSDSKSSRKSRSGRQNGQTRVKRRRVFRIARSMERQRVKDSAGVLLRYNKILVTYQKLKSMSRAFQVHGVDRNTVASTTPIAEMLLVAPEKVSEVGEFDSSKEKLLDYARRCYKALDENAHAKVQALKKNNLLLPISYRFRH
ncbi:coiled-coil domain-containing protein 106-like isoform X3 [Sinocyclocheilus anshuiensis]|uniref:coiled-coil domain-containing protein 106-like isoform X3 n=2 Tax=Sinocyclocheilus anshuiensis TaxID=1608454 RepID=UPI0007B7B4C1|nr:PREDICTED: coiled-coil domain-containing protein 106-like isoform X3 [Sinocyclocheilus anshuiensis]